MSWADNAKKLEDIQELQRPGTAQRLLNYIDEDAKIAARTTNVTKKAKSENVVKCQVNIRIPSVLLEDFKTLCRVTFTDVTTKLTEYIQKEVRSNKEKINEFREKNKKNRV